MSGFVSVCNYEIFFASSGDLQNYCYQGTVKLMAMADMGCSLRGSAGVLAAVLFSFVVACSCSRQVHDSPDDVALLDRRVSDCTALCEIQVGECGAPPNPIIPDVQTCVRECATVDGDLSGGWGYQQASGRDECAPEWKEHAACVVALSCADQKMYWQPAEQDPPAAQRPCYDETLQRSVCVSNHPCCDES